MKATQTFVFYRISGIVKPRTLHFCSRHATEIERLLLIVDAGKQYNVVKGECLRDVECVYCIDGPPLTNVKTN